MEDTLTAGELIAYLSKYDLDKKVIVSSVGFTVESSYDFPLYLEHTTVDEYKGIVRINFSNF
jgi:hypothetical protein